MLLPVLRRELIAEGVSRRVIDSRYVRLVRGVYLPPVPEEHLRHARLGPSGYHGLTGPFRHDIVTRARAHSLLHPRAVVGYWAAAAFHGLVHWADEAPVVLLTGSSKQGSMVQGARSTQSARPVLRPLPAGLRVMQCDRAFPGVRVVGAATAAVQCLTTILTGKQRWDVPQVPGLCPEHVRAVQFIDAFLQCTWVTLRQIVAASRNKVDAGVLRMLCGLVDPGYGAESPRETVLRLIVRDELPAGFSWSTQVTVDLGTTVTRPDIACPELKVALYYDGAHHLAQDTRDTDFRLFQKLRDIDWEAVRVNGPALEERTEMMENIRNAIARAVRAGT
jgi:very-short-patch-repair endonuclease